ncbi:MAG: hypothetical protein CBC71_08415 [Rhodobacteraceae bacterium TMED111]|nr:hypothetical protein [Marinovum sp.]OUV40094.1 MAG: hypothetical protein CBC71_08415 [Rhodobacteraceae bacterium TMED111]|tara:strand:- start:4158 stop:4346 length:189 start_codon:yes stop_codon:yes gene_type:complete
MKHEVIENPSTYNVLRMMFECRTFDEKNDEKEVRQFETVQSFKIGKANPVVSNQVEVKSVLI